MNYSTDGLCTFVTACRAANSNIPWICPDATENAQQDEYTQFREEFYEETIGKYDSDLDGMLSSTEMTTAISADSSWPTIDELMPYNDLNNDGFADESELYAQN